MELKIRLPKDCKKNDVIKIRIPESKIKELRAEIEAEVLMVQRKTYSALDVINEMIQGKK